jgi:AcrR family transcriptional regulator
MRDTKEHIVKTAFLLFMQKSYKAVTLKDIIAATGLSNGAFYHYFENKEQLFKEVVDHYLIGMTRRVFENYPQNSLHDFIRHTLDNFERIFDTLYKNAGGGANTNFFSFMFEALRYFPELEGEMIEMQALETDAWLKVIDIAKRNGEIKQHIPGDTIAKLFIYTSDGNRMDYVLDKDFNQLKSRMRTLWYDIYDMLKT